MKNNFIIFVIYFLFKIDLSICLITYALLFLIIFVILIKVGKDVFSSFMICISVCLLFLLVVFPPNYLKIDEENLSYSALYTVILLVSIFTCVVYTGVVASLINLDKISNHKKYY